MCGVRNVGHCGDVKDVMDSPKESMRIWLCHNQVVVPYAGKSQTIFTLIIATPLKKVRQLLCSDCNLVIGLAKENPAILASAILYLKKHGKNIATMTDGGPLSAEFLITRKCCCGNGCRNCPY